VRTIVHLSDLHFDQVDSALIEPAVRAITEIQPDILAVSGDLTQHAYPKEFEAAMEFLRRLPGVPVIVPGNHDMSFYNPWRRAVERLKHYRDIVGDDTEPFYSDAEIMVLGLNTARITHLRDGRIRSWQVDTLERRMAEAADDVIRVLVTHHPFDLPIGFHGRELVGRGRQYIPRVVHAVDVLLAGHMHISFAGPTAVRFRIQGQSAVFVQAGTALSTRRRTECNSFQVIRTWPMLVETEQWVESNGMFLPAQRHTFRKESREWRAVSPSTPAVEA
jgi:3',5'-cyclic AMP phosphodiesterase CpdA